MSLRLLLDEDSQAKRLVSVLEKAGHEVFTINEVASAIIAARSQANLTQKELAELMSAKQSLIARLEAGEQNTTIKTLNRIAQATNTRHCETNQELLKREAEEGRRLLEAEGVKLEPLNQSSVSS